MTNELTVVYGLHDDLTPNFSLGLASNDHTSTPSRSHHYAQGYSSTTNPHGHRNAHNITARAPTGNRPTRTLPVRRPRPPTANPSTLSQVITATPLHSAVQDSIVPDTGVSWCMSENPEYVVLQPDVSTYSNETL